MCRDFLNMRDSKESQFLIFSPPLSDHSCELSQEVTSLIPKSRPACSQSQGRSHIKHEISQVNKALRTEMKSANIRWLLLVRSRGCCSCAGGFLLSDFELDWVWPSNRCLCLQEMGCLCLQAPPGLFVWLAFDLWSWDNHRFYSSNRWPPFHQLSSPPGRARGHCLRLRSPLSCVIVRNHGKSK